MAKQMSVYRKREMLLMSKARAYCGNWQIGMIHKGIEFINSQKTPDRYDVNSFMCNVVYLSANHVRTDLYTKFREIYPTLDRDWYNVMTYNIVQQSIQDVRSHLTAYMLKVLGQQKVQMIKESLCKKEIDNQDETC